MRTANKNKRMRLLAILYMSLEVTSSHCAQKKPTMPAIMPSVVHGICTSCNSSSCARCSKCSAAPCIRDDRDCDTLRTCTFCSDKSPFCSLVDNRNFEDTLEPRTVCGSKDDKNCSLGCSPLRSVFIPRSVGSNTARELAGWEEFIHQFAVGDYYLTTGHVLGYGHSFRSERIARALFGATTLCFAGSQVAHRGRCELLADNFGLSPHFRGSLHIHPVIENIFFDNQFFIGLDPLLCGLYVRAHLPIVHTRWNLELRQSIKSNGCQDFPACYMGENSQPALCDIIEALKGQFTFGEMQEPWRFGRFREGTRTKTGVADIDLIAGYDWWQCDTSHVGVYGQLVVPTGNKPSACFIFEPLIGNGKHWELGIGISAHLVLWERDTDQNLAVYLEGNVAHLFKNTQMRSFDFCNNGPLSRYMLLKELAQVNDSFEYTGRLINAINVATRPVEVSIAAKADFSAKFSYRSPCFIADIGYNFYGQTKEHLTFKKCSDTRVFGIKGTEGVCALEYETVGSHPPLSFGPLVQKIPLNATQSNATIRRSASTDNPVAVPASPDDITVTAFSRQEGVIEGPDVLRAFESVPPVLITQDSLHKRSGAMQAQATHKIFGYLGYNFFSLDWCYNPYLGLGGEVEFDARTCEEFSALNQWSVWVKGGFEF